MIPTAKFVSEIRVTDPDTQLPVEVDLFKHENGGMFAIDASFLDQVFEDDEEIIVPDPFSNNGESPEVGLVRLTRL